ncbi:MAG: hypothetical protein LBV33_06525 [Lachnospiraceae bacterium]|nr:hypothetical protein [Lachnospiraceae bacterium]
MDTIITDWTKELISDKELTFEEVLDSSSKEELDNLKSWLFAENIRIGTALNELEQIRQKFEDERAQFKDEMKSLNHKLIMEKKRLKEDNILFDKKMEILKSGFSQLDMDKRKLEKDKLQLRTEKEIAWESTHSHHSDTAELLFRGVNSPLSLKKRYKDLVKMYHPDNVAGDHEMVLLITRIFEKMKSEFDYEKQA